jgi:hypothetical protein
VTSALDRVGTLEPGHGRFELGAVLSGGENIGVLGAFADYQHRVSERWSLFGSGKAGVAWTGDDSERFYEGLLGGRWMF